MTAWADIIRDCEQRIAAIVPSIAPDQRWRQYSGPRDEQQPGRDRLWRWGPWKPDGDPVTHGAGEIESRRVAALEVDYLDGSRRQDRLHGDWRDLIVALQRTSTYPAGLRVRRVVLPNDEPTRPKEGVLRHRFLLALTWRESLRLV